MAASKSDALVLFGVTGDLAHKMTFPALYAMVKRGTLTVPVLGVAFPKWSLERLHKRVTDSIERSGGIDNRRALKHLLSLFKYVSGDYKDPATFTAIKKELGNARRPAHYLAIPPSLFETVIQGLGKAGLAKTPASSSKNHSDAISPLRASLPELRIRYFRKTRSSASTTSSGRRRS
jgi:glucose-6-phosphate 1-dehydrogenase